MFGKTITLFRIFGFAVRIDLSWLIILVLVVSSLAQGVFPEEQKGLAVSTYWVMGLVAAGGLFLSIVAHELCHSLVARRYGLPMNGITLFMLGGVAEMSDEPPTPKAEFMMAAAGPISSLIIAAIFIAAARFGARHGWPGTAVTVLRWIGVINAILAVFNMIPGFPLDGGRILRSIFWYFGHDLRKATHIASRVGMGFGLFLIALGILDLLLRNPVSGMWWVLIGMFLRGAARQSYQQVLIRQAFKGEPVRRFINPNPVTVPSSLPVEALVDQYIYTHHYKMFPVVDEDRLLGCVTTRKIRGVPRAEWPRLTVGDVLEVCSKENTVPAGADAMEVLAQMSRQQASRLLVVEDGRLAGIVSLKDMLKFLSLKLELEQGGPDSSAGGGADF